MKAAWACRPGRTWPSEARSARRQNGVDAYLNLHDFLWRWTRKRTGVDARWCPSGECDERGSLRLLIVPCLQNNTKHLQDKRCKEKLKGAICREDTRNPGVVALKICMDLDYKIRPASALHIIHLINTAERRPSCRAYQTYR